MTRRTLRDFAKIFLIGVSWLAIAGCGGAQARKAKHLEKGQNYLAAGNLEKARVEFQNAVQIAPLDAEARFEMGVVDEKLGKVREAAQFYQGTIDVSPDHLGARTNLARLYVLSGVSDRALEIMQPAIDKHPDDAELVTLRAAIHLQRKEVEAGLADAQRAVQLDPRNEDAVATLAGVYVSNKEYDKAQQLLETAIVGLPATTELRLVLAQTYANQGKLADSERVLLDLVKLHPNERAHRIRLAQFYSRQNNLDAAEQVLREAGKALPADRELKLSLIDFIATRRSPAAAEAELKTMVAADPKDFELKFALAKFYQGAGKVAQAEDLYQKVIKSEQLDAAGLTARDRLAESRAQQNDVAGAEKLIGEVLAKSPRDDDALVLRGNIALSRKDPKAAIADLRAVLRDQPNSVPVLRTLARAHLANGEPAIAEETLRRALEAGPKDPVVRLDLAQLLAQIGKPEQAKPILADLTKEQPNNVAALDSLFRVCVAVQDYATAQSAAEAMVSVRPKDAIGYFYEGLVAEQDRRLADAARFYAAAVDLEPTAFEPLEAQIRLMVLEKKYPEAVKRLDEVAATAPAVALAPNMKGDLLLAQHHLPDAREAYKAAQSRLPKWWEPYRGLAKVQLAEGDQNGALQTLRNAEASVDQPEMLGLEIATELEAAGKVEDAIREYEDVLRRKPQIEMAANNLAMLLATYRKDAGSLDQAKKLAARFAESKNLSYLDTYGWVLYKHGETAASVPVLESVVARAPKAAEARYHLGMALAQAGNNLEARDNLTRAVDSGTKFAGLDEARATLDRLAKLPANVAPET